MRELYVLNDRRTRLYLCFFFFLRLRRPPRSTQSRSSAASDVYKRQAFDQPITISSNSDEVLYYANCVDSYYGDFIGYWSFPCQERERQVVDEPRDEAVRVKFWRDKGCLLYTSPSPRDRTRSRMPSSA